jgi:hypothetical protein
MNKNRIRIRIFIYPIIFMRIRDPGSGMEKIQIRDQVPRMKKVLIQAPGNGMGKIQIWDPGSGINIPDQQNWKFCRQTC